LSPSRLSALPDPDDTSFQSGTAKARFRSD
jgi:hypothetical protein